MRLWLCIFETARAAVLLIAWLPPASAQEAAAPPSLQRGDIEVVALRQQSDGDWLRARGHVKIRLNHATITAREVDYNQAAGDIEARGDVHYLSAGGDQDLFASKLHYNLNSELGTFYDVHGTVAAASQGGFRILTTDNPFYIDGEVVHKTGGTYVVHGGTVTNCDPGNPWWKLRSPKTKIIPGKQATVHRAVFRLKNVPLFYFPYFTRSLERLPRKSGFLTPNLGNSSRFGLILGQSYFWAINRSYDATIGGTWYTDRGVATQLAFRGRPTRRSHFDAVFFGVKDRGLRLDDGRRLKQGGGSFSMRGATWFPGGFRGVANINYLSSLEFRQAFTQTYEEAVFSQVRSIGFVTKSFSSFSLNTSLLRDESFQSVTAGDTVIVRKLPNVEFNSHDRQILAGPAPLWLRFDTSFDLVSRTQPLFQTRRFVQRGDFFPRVTSQFYWKGFHVTPALGARYTAYGQSREDDGRLAGRNLHRKAGEISVDIRPPALQRIYRAPKWLGDRVKHVIEPRLSYRYMAGVEDFDRIIRFDDRDILNNTNEAEISLTNRLYAKDDNSGRVNEVLTLEVRQRRYFDPQFGGAIVPGRRNVLRSTIDVTPFGFADGPRNYSPVVSELRLKPNWRYSLSWRHDYDPLRGRIVNSSVRAGMQVNSLIRAEVGHHAVRAPTTISPPGNQIFTLVRFGDFNRRGWNAAVSNVYDFRQSIFLYTVSQVTYNTDCCGFSFEVRRLAIGRTRNENQFRVGLSIANVGSFGTLRPQERLF